MTPPAGTPHIWVHGTAPTLPRQTARCSKRFGRITRATGSC